MYVGLENSESDFGFESFRHSLFQTGDSERSIGGHCEAQVRIRLEEDFEKTDTFGVVSSQSYLWKLWIPEELSCRTKLKKLDYCMQIVRLERCDDKKMFCRRVAFGRVGRTYFFMRVIVSQ